MLLGLIALIATSVVDEPPAAPPSDAVVAPTSTANGSAVGSAVGCAPHPGAVLRIAVAEPVASGVSPRLPLIVQDALTTELRKLRAVTVIATDEMRTLLSAEANRQEAGCSDASCLSELADALGADVLVTISLNGTGSEHILSLRRLDTHTADVKSVDRRFAQSDGEEFLAALGPSVAELFADRPLRVGATRGVDKELALRLNPPPIPLWGLASAGGATLLVLTLAGALGAESLVFQGQAQRLVDGATVAPTAGTGVRDLERTAGAFATSANVAYAGTAALALTTAALALFTDFHGYADAQ